MSRKKRKLVLIHSFPTNSILLKGLIDFLNDYFDLYFIDLPGFIKTSPPLEKISISSYSEYVKQKIDSLNIKDFWIGGISFGFLIANDVARQLSRKQCRGIIAMEPFIDYTSLEISYIKRENLLNFIRLVCLFKLERKVWKSKYFKRLLGRMGSPANRVSALLKTVDPRTFFLTAKLLLGKKRDIAFVKLPYILVNNPHDETVFEDKITNLFASNVAKICSIKTSSEHYPINPTRLYFKNHISQKSLKEILKFMNKQ